jgi:leucyl aminopeptidase
MAIKLAGLDKLTTCETLALGLTTEPGGLLRGLPEPLRSELERLRRMGDLKGKAQELHVLYPSGRGPNRILVVGLGAAKKLTLQEVRRAVGLAAKKAQELSSRELVLGVESFQAGRFDLAETAEALALAATLACYQFREFKTRPETTATTPKLVLASSQPAKCSQPADRGEITAAAANFARTLGNRPGNKLHPQALAQEAQALARRCPGLTVHVISKPQLERAGFGALLAVGQGSIHPPVLIEAIYKGGSSKDAPIALVGKGITFDSGGICLKGSNKLEDMRFDMCGAAAVLGTLEAAARLRLPVNLVGILPAAENLPSGSAYRPGDVLTSLSGKTIEVLNTDAEGRLILADALTYALRHKPECIVDLATLTGAVLVALGNAAVGMIANQDGLAGEITAAGERSGERVWRLPLWDEYRDLLKSDVADVANIGSKPGAGTILGGAFLEKFVDKTPWVHLDIAGTAYGDAGPLYAKGATGVGVRLLMDWLGRRKHR